MNEDRRLLDEALKVFPPPADALERLRHRKARQERNRRVVAGALALVVVTGGVLIGRQLVGLRPTPEERRITAANVSRLQLAWQAELGEVAVAGVAASEGIVYAGSDDLYALDVDTGRVLWRGVVDGFVATPPTVSEGVVYVGARGEAGGSGVYAFPVSCEEPACDPLWVGRAEVHQPPVVAEGVVFVRSDTTLWAFEVGCAIGGGTCEPLWTASLDAGGDPAVAEGMVYVVADETLQALPVSCGTGGGRCQPTWVGAAGSQSFAATPAVLDGVVYATSRDGEPRVYGFSVTCGTEGAVCQPDRRWATERIITPPALGEEVYWLSVEGSLYAVPGSCDPDQGGCRPLWRAGTGGSSFAPAVVGEILYVASGEQVHAFALSCATGGELCEPAWTGSVEDRIVSSPVVTSGSVFVSAGHRVYAFGLPA